MRQDPLAGGPKQEAVVTWKASTPVLCVWFILEIVFVFAHLLTVVVYAHVQWPQKVFVHHCIYYVIYIYQLTLNLRFTFENLRLVRSSTAGYARDIYVWPDQCTTSYARNIYVWPDHRTKGYVRSYRLRD